MSGKPKPGSASGGGGGGWKKPNSSKSGAKEPPSKQPVKTSTSGSQRQSQDNDSDSNRAPKDGPSKPKEKSTQPSSRTSISASHSNSVMRNDGSSERAKMPSSSQHRDSRSPDQPSATPNSRSHSQNGQNSGRSNELTPAAETSTKAKGKGKATELPIRHALTAPGSKGRLAPPLESSTDVIMKFTRDQGGDYLSVPSFTNDEAGGQNGKGKDRAARNPPPKRILSKNRPGHELCSIFTDSGLPTEIREMIWAYMLNHKTVKYYPENPPTQPHRPPLHSSDYEEHYGQAHTWNFSFNLFKINKKTKQEALDYFDSNNDIVHISWRVELLKKCLHTFAIPIISDSELVQHSTLPVARIDFDWPTAARNAYHEDEAWQENMGDAVPSGHFLMMKDDFGKLCMLMKYLCQRHRPPGVYITSGRGQPLEIAALNKRNTPKIELRILRPDRLSHGRRMDLVGELNQIIGGGHGLQVTSADVNDPVTQAPFVNSLQLAMAPRLIWISAQELDRIRTAYAWRAKGLDSNNMREIWNRYLLIFTYFSLVQSRTFGRWYNANTLADVPEQVTIFTEGLPLLIYTLFDWILLCMRMRDSEDLAGPFIWRTHQRLLMHVRDGGNSGYWQLCKETRMHLDHLNILRKLQQNGHKRFSEVSGDIQTMITRICADYPEHYRQLTHDLDVLSPLLDPTNSERGNPLNRKVLDQTSLYWEGADALWKLKAPPKLPETKYIPGIEGWVDKIHLASLTDEDKQAIHALQKQNDLALSDFPGHKCSAGCTRSRD